MKIALSIAKVASSSSGSISGSGLGSESGSGFMGSCGAGMETSFTVVVRAWSQQQEFPKSAECLLDESPLLIKHLVSMVPFLDASAAAASQNHSSRTPNMYL